MKWNSFALFLALLQAVKGQQISGYGPVDVAELNPLTLNWNQVGFKLNITGACPVVLNFARFARRSTFWYVKIYWQSMNYETNRTGFTKNSMIVSAWNGVVSKKISLMDHPCMEKISKLALY